MATGQVQVRLGSADLRVEAGATVETDVAVWPAAGLGECELRVHGLPERWYSLAARRLSLSSGEPVKVLLVVHPPHEDPDHPLGEYEFAVEAVPRPAGEPASVSGRLLVLPPGATALRSRLLEYLPAIYRSDEFLSRFLLIFQSLVDPIEQRIDSTHHYLDPDLTPSRFLPWLASWVGCDLDPSLDEPRQRELIRQAVELSRWKGTRRGLREELRIRTGGRALIVENFDGLRLGQDACLGLNTHLGVRRDHCIAVTLASDEPATLDQRQIDALIHAAKPAHVGHVARIVSTPSNTGGGARG